MIFAGSKKLLAIVTLVTLNSCNGQTPNSIKPASHNDTPKIDNSDGIVYFSYDNGLSWQNKSTGLSPKANIGLGGIAASGHKLALMSKDSGLYIFNAPENRWKNIPTGRQFLESNPGALIFYKNGIYTGTQHAGVFYSIDNGNSWAQANSGLNSLVIRKFATIENKLYAATNSGLYSYKDIFNQWELEFGDNSFQVNGITSFDKSIYIATNQGAFASPIGKKDWRNIFSKGALHNISSDDKTLYAMVYNELFSSTDKGNTWQSIQNGLPVQLYTFNVVKTGNSLLAGQWDGVYRKEKQTGNWIFSGKGLPEKLAIVNMQVHDKIIVVSSSERKLKTGMTTDK